MCDTVCDTVCIVYSFVRKEELFEKLHSNLSKYNIMISNNNNHNNDNVKSEELNDIFVKDFLENIIMNRDLGLLSKFFETASKFEKEFIVSNEIDFETFLNASKWKKGLKLFKLFIKQWKK